MVVDYPSWVYTISFFAVRENVAFLALRRGGMHAAVHPPQTFYAPYVRCMIEVYTRFVFSPLTTHSNLAPKTPCDLALTIPKRPSSYRAPWDLALACTGIRT